MRPALRSAAALAGVVAAFAVLSSSASAASISLHSGNGTVGGTDSQITFVDTVNGSGNAFIVSPATSSNPNFSWSAPLSGSQWVSTAANRVGGNSTYSIHFTLPSNFTSASLSVTLLADNLVTSVALNGTSFGHESAATPPACTTQFFVTGGQRTFSTSTGFVPGANTLSFAVDNCLQSQPVGPNNPTGLDFVATVTYTTPSQPANEDACENGGWRSLVDSSGHSFADQNACTAAATGTTIGTPVRGQCSGLLIASAVTGDLTVPNGATCVLGQGASVSHDVHVGRGATLYVEGASVGHDLDYDEPQGVDVDAGSQIGHDLEIEGLLGHPAAEAHNEVCGANIVHDLSVTNGAAAAAALEIGCPDEGGGNTIGHDLNVHNNANTVTVQGNKATHMATCHDNTHLTGSGNTPAPSTCNT